MISSEKIFPRFHFSGHAIRRLQSACSSSLLFPSPNLLAFVLLAFSSFQCMHSVRQASSGLYVQRSVVKNTLRSTGPLRLRGGSSK